MNILAITWDWSAFDSLAIIIGVVGIIVVFTSLVFLSFVYKLIPKILGIKVKNKFFKKKEGSEEEEIHEPSGEDYAAIGAALHLYFNSLTEHESSVLSTQNKEVKRLSAWADKHQMVNQNFNRYHKNK